MKKRRSILLVKPESDQSEHSEEEIETEDVEDKSQTLSENEDDQDEKVLSDADDDDENEDVNEENSEKQEVNGKTPKENGKSQKKRKPGIIYISSIPKHMNVTLIREYLSPFGDLGRVFLQPDKKFLTRKKKLHSTKPLAMHFTEGWVEFLSKRRAKQAAELLNNQPISTKKNSRFCDILWSLKYLPRFKWVHLSERLTYEKQMYKQKLQAEISQARKEANFFQANLDKSERVKKVNKKKAKEERKLNKAKSDD
uniref:Activator of basal transcription 1 n=1 Tax=Culicoides sonorensis TaxID=179676 RepID=A0A336MAR9_CULSO